MDRKKKWRARFTCSKSHTKIKGMFFSFDCFSRKKGAENYEVNTQTKYQDYESFFQVKKNINRRKVNEVRHNNNNNEEKKGKNEYIFLLRSK